MDSLLVRALNGLRSPALDAVANALGRYAYYGLPLLLLLALVPRGRRASAASVRDGVLAWFLATLLAEDVIKSVVSRPRPPQNPSLRASLHVLGRVPPPG